MAGAAPRLKRRVAYRQGLLSNLSNPKIVVFFLSLLPQFIDRGQPSARVGDFLRRDRVRRAVEATTGLALVGLGLKLATDRR